MSQPVGRQMLEGVRLARRRLHAFDVVGALRKPLYASRREDHHVAGAGLPEVPYPAVYENEVARHYRALPEGLAGAEVATSYRMTCICRQLERLVARADADVGETVVARRHARHAGGRCLVVDYTLARPKPLQDRKREHVPRPLLDVCDSVVAPEGLLHGAGRDVERLVEVGAEAHRDGDCDDERVKPLAAVVLPGLGRSFVRSRPVRDLETLGNLAHVR